MSIFKFSDQWNTWYFLWMLAVAFGETMLLKIAIKKRDGGFYRSFKLYIFLAFFLLFFFETLRSSSTGNDTIKYVGFFLNGGLGIEYLLVYGFEPLFTVYVYFISSLSDSYNVLFAVNASIGAYAFIKFVLSRFNRNDTYMFLPLFIINYSYNLSSMRSSLGLAFMLLSIIALDEGRKKKSILLSIVAMFFHYSFVFHLLFMLYLIFLSSQSGRINRTRLILFSVLMLVISFAGTYFLQELLASTKYGEYSNELGSGWLGQWNIVLACIISFFLIKIQREKKMNTDEVINILVFSFLPIYVLLNAYRIPTYYLLCRISTYTKFVNRLEKGQRGTIGFWLKIIEFAVLIFVLLFYATRIQSGMQYEFVWE